MFSMTREALRAQIFALPLGERLDLAAEILEDAAQVGAAPFQDVDAILAGAIDDYRSHPDSVIPFGGMLEGVEARRKS
jgi:hypothetical protein